MTVLPTSTHEPSLRLIRNIYEAFAGRDLATVLSLFSADIEIVQSAELPWGGEYLGHEGATEFFRQLAEHLNSTVTLERLIRAGNHVVAVGWTRGTAHATGSRYEVPFVHVWTVSGGRVARAEFYIDHPAMLPALGRSSE